MSAADEFPLRAIVLDGPRAASAVAEAWDRGTAAAPLDPRLPAAVLEARLDALRPTEVLDRDGLRRRPGGWPTRLGCAAVLATSGTTGAPRFVELGADALAASARGVQAALGTTADDRWLACVPLHAVAGLAILARARTANQPVTVHPRFDARAVVDAFRHERTTLVSLVATMLRRVAALGDDALTALASGRATLLGGGPIPAPLIDATRRAQVPTVVTYGMTETGGGCVHDGRPLPGVDLRIDPTTSEIQLRGPVLMLGYRGDPEATGAAYTSDGWFRTGDAGRLDQRGMLHVVDRLRDLVISGGVNVSPSAVERVLADHPAVADVAVTGAGDPEWGERVVAHVVPADRAAPPTLDDLREHARERLTAAELPRECRLVDAIPRTVGGKMQRAALGAPVEVLSGSAPPAGA